MTALQIDPERWYTIDELREMPGLSEATLKRLLMRAAAGHTHFWDRYFQLPGKEIIEILDEMGQYSPGDERSG